MKRGFLTTNILIFSIIVVFLVIASIILFYIFQDVNNSEQDRSNYEDEIIYNNRTNVINGSNLSSPLPPRGGGGSGGGGGGGGSSSGGDTGGGSGGGVIQEPIKIAINNIEDSDYYIAGHNFSVHYTIVGESGETCWYKLNGETFNLENCEPFSINLPVEGIYDFVIYSNNGEEVVKSKTLKIHSKVFDSEYSAGDCFDGIDNDDDGLLDFQDLGGAKGMSLGCFGPNSGEGPSSSQGWFRIYRALNLSSDSNVIYVSSSEGNDSNDGLSPQTSKKTLSEGYALLRAGYPDWLLLKRGDVWENEYLGNSEGIWEKSGRSVLEPMVVGSYGYLVQRPVLKIGNDTGWKDGVEEINYLSINGIRFYSHTRDKTSPEYLSSEGGKAIDRTSKGDFFLLQDNRFDYAGVYLDIVSGELNNLTMRANSVYNNYPISDEYSYGLFISGIINSRISFGVLDNNGGDSDRGNNVYITNKSANLTLDSLLISRGSVGLRTDSPITRIVSNVFVENQIDLFQKLVSPGADSSGSSISQNIFIGKKREGPENSASIFLETINSSHELVITGNIFSDNSNSKTIIFNGENGIIRNLNINENIIYNWKNQIEFRGIPLENLFNISIKNNDFQANDYSGGKIFLFRDFEFQPSNNDSLTFSENRYNSISTPDSWFADLQGDFSYEGWVNKSGEINSQKVAVIYFDPDRTIERYSSEIVGREMNFTQFLSETKKAGKFFEIRSENNYESWQAISSELWSYYFEGFDEIDLSPLQNIKTNYLSLIMVIVVIAIIFISVRIIKGKNEEEISYE